MSSVLNRLRQSDPHSILPRPMAIRGALQGFTLAVLATTAGMVPVLILNVGHGARASVPNIHRKAEIVSASLPDRVNRANEKVCSPTIASVASSESLSITSGAPAATDRSNRERSSGRLGRERDNRIACTPPSAPISIHPAMTSAVQPVTMSSRNSEATEHNSLGIREIGVSKVESTHLVRQVADSQDKLSAWGYEKHERPVNVIPSDSPFEAAVSSGPGFVPSASTAAHRRVPSGGISSSGSGSKQPAAEPEDTTEQGISFETAGPN